MNFLHRLLAMLAAPALMIILLISAVEIVAYKIPGYYRYEYARYRVTEAVDIEMDELLEVTDEMMSYLRGDRDSFIDIKADYAGKKNFPFFNEKEAAHMLDVRNLFIAAIYIRRALLAALIFIAAFIRFTGGSIRKLLPSSIIRGSVLFFIMLAALALIISTDFTRYFYLFHHIFFNNDLWLLDPATDNLINIVPEPFFIDTARNIAIVYALLISAVMGICTLLTRRQVL